MEQANEMRALMEAVAFNESIEDKKAELDRIIAKIERLRKMESDPGTAEQIEHLDAKAAKLDDEIDKEERGLSEHSPAEFSGEEKARQDQDMETLNDWVSEKERDGYISGGMAYLLAVKAWELGYKFGEESYANAASGGEMEDPASPDYFNEDKE